MGPARVCVVRPRTRPHGVIDPPTSTRPPAQVWRLHAREWLVYGCVSLHVSAVRRYDLGVERRCANPDCRLRLSVGAHGNALYCDNKGKCARRARFLSKRDRAARVSTGRVPGRLTRAESADGRATARRGPGYVKWCSEGWPQKIAAGSLSFNEVIEETGESQGNVSRWWAAFEEDEALRLAREDWCRASEVEALLEPTPEKFAEFRLRYFVNERQDPYTTEPFHLKWIAALLVALATGGRLMILSPPRHGKTQLLIHFCVWLICRNPNIRIIWIGLNEDNAKEAVGAALDILENHETLRADMLPPGVTWKPNRRGLSWTNGKLVVGNRVGVGIKGPTMRAVGKGSGLLSKDADIVIGDDIQDGEAYESPSSREKDSRWIFSQVSSRKEDTTAFLVIGSRQHHEDLYGRIDNNPAWTSIIESAHSPDCPIPVHTPRAGHTKNCPECALHVDCMLWPGFRTMAWLQELRMAGEDDVLFEMVYFNKTKPSGARYVTEVQIDACKNVHRRVGRWIDRDLGLKDVEIPAGCLLVGGLDPAVRGHQAAVLWAYDLETRVRHFIDCDNREAGGLPGARDVIKEWDELYDCKSWVVERNGYQEAILQDGEIIKYCQENGVHLEPHFTSGHNKFDPHFGVTKQLELFGKNLIDLPWGDAATVAKVQVAIQQWVNFEPDTRKKTDLVMAGWLPENTFRRFRRNQNRKAKVNYEQTSYDDGIGSTYERVAS